MKKEEIIEKLGLTPLVGEGGFAKEMYRSKKRLEGRSACGTIYYMLTNRSCSTMHKLNDDETWYYHGGQPLKMLLIYEDHSEIKKLGMDLPNGERPQITIEAGVWQGCLMDRDGEYTLVSTSMAPAYDPDGFVSGSYEQLLPLLSNKEHIDLLSKLTDEPRYE